MIVESLLPLAMCIDDLVLLPGNPRRGDVDAVARSLDAFGQRKPIVAKRDGTVIAGNHTLMAARQLGWETIAVTYVDDDDDTAKAYALADNRTAELGGYDDESLALMMADVKAADESLYAATGWDDGDLALLQAKLEPPTPDDLDDEDAAVYSAPAITVAGDVWLLGPHRIMCGDCRVPTDVDRLLDGALINLAFTSPPYAEQRTYDESSGFKPIKPGAYVEWFRDVAANVAANLADDGSWFVNIKPPGVVLDTDLYVFDLVIAHVREWGWHFATEFCWQRLGVPKSVARRFKNQFEPVYQFARGDWKMRPDAVRHPSDNVPTNVGPGGGDAAWRHGAQGSSGAGRAAGFRALDNVRPNGGTRGNQADGQGKRPRKGGTTDQMSAAQGRNAAPGEYMETGLAYPGNMLPTFAATHTATGHAAAFPVGLPQFFVKAYTDEGDAVYDPFMGSGSTLLAAHAERRIGYGMELSPGYVDIICKRFETVTGIIPIAEATGNEHTFLT